MTLSTRKTVPTMLGAIALALSLSLVGCGSSATSNTDTAKTESTEADSTATKTETTDKATDSKDVSVDSSAEEASEASRSVIGGVDEGAIKDFEALPKSDDSINMFDTTELVENDKAEDTAGEESVTRSNGVDDVFTRYSGGITIDIPMNWEEGSTSSSSSRLFQCPDYRASIVLASDFKKSGQSYNVEAMVKAIPQQAQKNGVKNIQVVGYEPLYSGNNNYVGGEVMYMCESNGLTVAILDRLIESKNYINLVEITVAQSDVEAHARQLQSILDSCKFSSGEAI